jgi:hypothetical protein
MPYIRPRRARHSYRRLNPNPQISIDATVRLPPISLSWQIPQPAADAPASPLPAIVFTDDGRAVLQIDLKEAAKALKPIIEFACECPALTTFVVALIIGTASDSTRRL